MRPSRTCNRKINYAVSPATSTGRKSTLITPKNFSPTELALKLQELHEKLDNAHEIGDVLLELKGFDLNHLESLEEYVRLRDAIREQTGNPETFDEGGRTAINVDAAAIAGAKMIIDNERSTRSLSKKLMQDTGVSENDILYKGVPMTGPELKGAKAVKNSRLASQFESLVDFQKQIAFKMNVLKHMAANPKGTSNLSKSDGRITRGRVLKEVAKKEESKAAKRKGRNVVAEGMKTPKQKEVLNPLDDKRIYDAYACNIASEIREEQKKRRRTAPIPFNINLLDDDDDNEGDDAQANRSA